jgi:hypothetical protein
MTGLRIAFLFVAVVTGDYAALMLIDGQLIDFGVAAAICAGSSVAAGLIAYADDEHARRQHELGRRQRKAATAADRQCPSCGGVRQNLSDSPRFVDRQGACLCRTCAGRQLRADTTSPALASPGIGSGGVWHPMTQTEVLT